jgi:hypothetical protein
VKKQEFLEWAHELLSELLRRPIRRDGDALYGMLVDELFLGIVAAGDTIRVHVWSRERGDQHERTFRGMPVQGYASYLGRVEEAARALMAASRPDR